MLLKSVLERVTNQNINWQELISFAGSLPSPPEKKKYELIALGWGEERALENKRFLQKISQFF